jgi:cation transport regulator
MPDNKPFNSLKDLPYLIKDELPPHAQEIWMKSYNNALQEYQNPKNRRNPAESADVTAYKVAWAAVDTEYKKDKSTGKWVKKEQWGPTQKGEPVRSTRQH